MFIKTMKMEVNCLMELLQKSTIDLQHYAGIHHKRYSKQPQAIDIDDDNEVTEPQKVLKDLKDICTGLFYTFSHGKKGNRYRLLFQLDESITDEDDLKLLIEYMNYYLQSKDLPADSLAPGSTIPIRGGVKGYEVNNLNITLNTDKWLSKAKEHFAERINNMREQQKKKTEQMKNNLNNPVTYDELKEMIETIGHIPSGEGRETTKKWLQIVYALKHQVQMELLEEDEGFELFHIVSGGESGQKQWNDIKPTGQVSVGTIVYHATESGYRRKHAYNQSLQVASDIIDHEQINVKQYIPVDVAVELLQRNQKLLVDSPTNSGKTTAFIDAFKQLANEDNHYYIFTAPTTALTEQIAKEHNLPSIIGGKKNLKHNVVSHALKGQKIFVSVYDKTTDLVGYLKK